MAKTVNTIIYWFRQDLRLADNPALCHATKRGKVLPIYILDDINAGDAKMGAASRWWLHQSLTALNKSLKGKLCVYCGDALKILPDIAKNNSVDTVYWNRCYEPWRIARDKKIKEKLSKLKISCHSFNGSLLWEPWENLKADDTPYKVFTPFYNKGCLTSTLPRTPIAKPKLILHTDAHCELSIDDLCLMPKLNWYKQMEKTWKVGEAAAQKRLQDFLQHGINNYKQGRDFPALSCVSRLSPHLRFGEISPNQVWHAALGIKKSDDQQHFLRELGWREFSYSLLYHFPHLPKQNLQQKFDNFPWQQDNDALEAWQTGQTGIPIVDAGMRELWQTGYMHNRVRMIVASFLVKNLLIHWHEGEAWFWDCLVDADLANNSASWQWVAGCGADAAPYFRIFNPVTQGQKFDAHGEYTRQFVPELANLPDKYLFNPWQAPAEVLKQANITLGETYPEPIVDLKQSREDALMAFKTLSSADS